MALHLPIWAGFPVRHSEFGANELRRQRVFLIIGIVLVLLWVGGFVVFHAAGFLIHILLILAVISIVFHFLRGGTKSV